MADFTTRTERIIGPDGVNRLAGARVLVIGCGGVGSSCAEALARGGIGHLGLVDRDKVEASNINRQAIAFHSTIGKRKVDVMELMVHDINPDCEVEAFDRFLKAEDIPAFFERYRDEPGPGSWNVDWVVDAVDTISTKLALAEFADKKGLPLVSSMGGGNKLNPEHFAFADIYETVNCPLCRIMRKEARKRGIASLRVLFLFKDPATTETEPGSERRDRSDLGTMSYVPPIMGQMLAGWVIRQLLQLDDGGCA